MNKKWFFGFLIALGLVIRVFGLFVEGTHDMRDGFYPWGQNVLHNSLANAFGGIYFPITYLFFGLSAWLSEAIPNLWFLPFKATNLFFEIVILIILLWKFKKFPGKILLFYWLNPWLILLGAWQGFWDALMIALMLGSVLIFESKKKVKYRYFLSGLMAGLALMVKPQAQALIAAACVFLIFKDVLLRRIKQPLAFVTGCALPFIVFSLYFYFSGKPIYQLLMSLITARTQFPTLVATEINIWHTVSHILQLLTNQSGRIYAIKIDPNLYTFFSTVSFIVALLVLFLLARKKRATMLDAVTLSSWLLPQIVVMSHSNHFILAAVLTISYVIRFPRLFLWPWLAAIALHFYNSFARYTFGGSSPLDPTVLDQSTLHSVMSFLQFIVSMVVIRRFFKLTDIIEDKDDRR